MKKLFVLTIALGLSISSVLAEEYQAPSFDFNKKLSDGWKGKDPKKADWENNYKVQDSPEAERNVASDEDEKVSRDPSSQPKDEVKEGPMHWPYNPED